MANLIQTEEFKSEYSPNLLPIKSLFKETISVSYSGDGSVTIVEDNAFAVDSRSAYLFTTYDVVTGISETFSFGDALQFMTTKAGNYIFSFNMLNTSNFGDEVLTDLIVEVWIDGNLEYTFTTEYDFNTFEQDYFYNFNCGFQAIEGKEVSFVFKLNGAYPGAGITPLKLYFSGFKCELDDKYLNIPTAFTFPIVLPQEDVVGWAYYADSLATPTITINTSYTQITIDKLGASTNELYLPKEIRGVSTLFDSNKITPISVGDDFDGRFDCTITAKTGSPTAIEFIIDISGATAGSNKAFTGWIQAIGNAPYDQSLPIDYFALATFLANGGRLYARTDTGMVTIGRRNIKISRKSKAQ